MLIEKKYLKIPVNMCAAHKIVRLKENGRLVYDFSLRIDAVAPRFTAYVDVSRFVGRDFEIEITPEIKIDLEQTDGADIPDLYAEAFRPQVHFSVKNGFNNDPNGLICYNGVYHMFFQYNPCGTEGWNVQWGHAVSGDLVHWEEKDPVLYPDERGMVFSGSAVFDERNVSGLGTKDNPPLLLFYTAAGNMTELSAGREFAQCMAYSTDGGKTYVKYDKNPLLPQVRSQNRDPKVVWVEELQKYVMVIYLTGADYGMFLSDDLLEWTPFTEYTLEGEWECPDIYPLSCGTERFWIVSGASGIYALGRFSDGKFELVGKEKRLEYSTVAYASQSFSGIKDRVVKVAWDKLSIPENGFTQQMGFPYEVRLERAEKAYYLAAQPVREIERLYKKDGGFVLGNCVLSEPLKKTVGDSLLDIRLCMDMDAFTQVRLGFFGLWLVMDGKENTVSLGGEKMPLRLSGGKIDLRVVVDRCSVEVFSDGGKCCMTSAVFCDRNLPYVQLESEEKICVERLEIWELESIYKGVCTR